MGSDSYRVEVLHYLNPHLLWVEVENKKSEDFIFEQVGVYGITPQEVTLNDINLEVETRKCQQWTPAAFLVMKKVFSDAAEVWFSPTHIDRRSSIFDDNIHKYGEFVIKKRNGKLKTLTQQLVKSGFAVFDTGLFHQELSAGNLKTKLSMKQKQDVIKQLEKYNNKPKKEWENAVKKKTAIFQKAKHLESLLTVENLEKHEKVQELLQNKIRDYERCKDVDENSIGRAITRHSSAKIVTEAPSSGKKKLELLKNKTKPSPPKRDTAEILMATKKFLEQNAVKRDISLNSSDNQDSDLVESGKKSDLADNTSENMMTLKKDQQNKDTVDVSKINKLNNQGSDFVDNGKQNIIDGSVNVLGTKKFLNNHTSKNNVSNITDNIPNDSGVTVDGTSAKIKKLLARKAIDGEKANYVGPNIQDSIKVEKESEGSNLGDHISALEASLSPVRHPKVKRKSKSPKIPEYDINNEKRVAYGPPGMNQSKLHLKIVPKDTLEEDNVLDQKNPENKEEIPSCLDFLDGLDSEVNIEISNKDILEKINEGINIENSVVSGNKIATALGSQNYLETKDQKEISIEKSKKDEQKDNKSQTDSSSEPQNGLRSIVLQRKLKLHKVRAKYSDDSLSSSDIAKDSSTNTEEEQKNTNESDDETEEVLEKLNLEYHNISPRKEANKENPTELCPVEVKNNVNPFKNLDATISVFVDKLVTPVLMVHTKMNKRIQPCMELRDVNFNSNIHVALANMSIKHPMMIQSVSWFAILRGYSLFMVSPLNSGKTMGYLPAVCRLVSDFKTDTLDNEGPSCIIVCATAKAASEVERLSKMFLGLKERVLTCYTGMDELSITTSLLNGCDLLICTPSILVRLLQITDFGVDLRRLATFVLDDCERLSEVYMNEVKFFMIKIKEMLRARVNKELKVQIIAASRIWCDFMDHLVKKAPNSVVCIGAFQECVLYSKANTTVTFVRNKNKINTLLEFLNQIDGSKRTVIVCRDDKEVEIIEKHLVKLGKVVFACNNTMTVHDLYNYSKSWTEYQEPLLGPILVCCDGNLTHLNITNAHYLVHFSLPQLFSMFCKRFSVLNDNYPSIFKSNEEIVKIQVLLEDSNVEQLPKILNFIKRCTNDIPPFLDDVCKKVLAEKDATKAKNLVPICDNLLAMGDCPDFWNCQERHAIIKEYDEPKDWMPKVGLVTFKILHYHTAVLYSVRLLSNIVNGKTVKYPQTYSTLSLKMGMYYSKESNKKLHGIPKVGDVCAVSIKLNFFARCQVMKILSHYKNGNPNYVLIKLIDEERFERCSDVYLYHLPDELKNIETHIIRVRLANIKPKDKDVTFSDLATSQLKKITDKHDLYLRGKVALTIGNCVLVDTLEACQDLTSLNETVVNEDFRKILLDAHAIPNPEHVPKLKEMNHEGKLALNVDTELVGVCKSSVKEQLKPNWAHLDHGDTQAVFFATAESPDSFFVRLVKFEDCMNILLKDIEKYVTENPEPLKEVKRGDFVLAKFPDDCIYERARIDEVYDDNRVKCFFVDQGDWRDILSKDLLEIPGKFLTQMPCQAIECRLIGLLPAGESWTEFGTNWFTDICFEDENGKIKQLYIKYFTKESATHTDGNKYGVVLIDTNSDQDVVINELMIEKNLAQENAGEVEFFQEFHLNKPQTVTNTPTDEDEWERVSNNEIQKDKAHTVPESLDKVFFKKPIRSVPLVEDDDDDDQWDVNITSDFMSLFKNLTSNAQQGSKTKVEETIPNAQQINLPAIKPNPLDVPIKGIKKDPEENVASSVKETVKADIDTEIENTIEVLDSDDLSSPESIVSGKIHDVKNEINHQVSQKDELRKPKVIWRQHNASVIIKIQLIGVESYNLEIGDRSMKFETFVNDTKYGFYFELYGVIDKKSYFHSNKGQYILVNLTKVFNKRWLTLTRDVGIKKWIVYDVDSIDTSSDDEDTTDRDTLRNIVENMHDSDTDSDDDFVDDARF